MLYIIGGKFKKRALLTPKTDKVRPTTGQMRETLFNICQLTIEGSSFLDLFAGSGAMGLEALSRGSAHATFVEKDRMALQVIKKNIAALQVEGVTTLFPWPVSKALAYFQEQNQKFDIIYADPPYGEGLGKEVLHFLDENSLINVGGSLFIEDSDKLPPPKNLQLLRQKKAGRTFLYEYRAS